MYNVPVCQNLSPFSICQTDLCHKTNDVALICPFASEVLVLATTKWCSPEWDIIPTGTE